MGQPGQSLRRVGWGLAALLLLAGCTLSGADRPDKAATAQAITPTASPLAASAATPAPEPSKAADDYREAVRLMHWDRAVDLLLALPEAEREPPEVQLALGRAALGAGRHAAAVKALEGLDARLPAAREEIQHWYAEAAAVAGPHEQAARLLESYPKVVDKLAAARAWQRAGALGKARQVADAAVKLAERTRRQDDEAEAHFVRAEIAEAKKEIAVAATDYRWFVTHATGDPRVRGAIAAIDRMKGALTPVERAEALAETADHDNLTSTLEVIADLAKKHPKDAVPLALAKARAVYKVRDYRAARDAYDAAAALPSGFAAEAKYYAARAAARTGDQDDALARYADISRRYPKNAWAERAAYRHAELLLVMGRFGPAADAWASYSSRFGKGKSALDARYGRAVALLSAGEAKKARPLLAGLRDDADHWRDASNLRHLEALAALQSGDKAGATKIWLELLEERPLTWAALAARARLASIEHAPLPPAMAAGKATPVSPLPIGLPAGPALLASVGLDQSAEARLAMMEQEAAQPFVGRESEALCEMYGRLSTAGWRFKAGVRAVPLEQLMRPPSSDERWAWECVYPRPFAEQVRAAEERHKLPAGLVHAVMRQESAFRTTAVSPVGARGLMQLMPTTASRAADELGQHIVPDEVTRPDLNISLGAFYLGKLLEGFKGSLPLTVAAYNAGPHAVRNWLVGGRDGIDLWVARIPYRETRHYVERVLANFARYQWLAGGAEAVTPLDLAIPEGTSIGDDAY